MVVVVVVVTVVVLVGVVVLVVVVVVVVVGCNRAGLAWLLLLITPSTRSEYINIHVLKGLV